MRTQSPARGAPNVPIFASPAGTYGPVNFREIHSAPDLAHPKSRAHVELANHAREFCSAFDNSRSRAKPVRPFLASKHYWSCKQKLKDAANCRIRPNRARLATAHAGATPVRAAWGAITIAIRRKRPNQAGKSSHEHEACSLRSADLSNGGYTPRRPPWLRMVYVGDFVVAGYGTAPLEFVPPNRRSGSRLADCGNQASCERAGRSRATYPASGRGLTALLASVSCLSPEPFSRSSAVST